MPRENPLFFISYAHAANKQKIVEHFLDILRHQKYPNWTIWTDQAIPIGAKLYDNIKQALPNCDFGILLVSGAYATALFINKEELPILLK